MKTKIEDAELDAELSVFSAYQFHYANYDLLRDVFKEMRKSKGRPLTDDEKKPGSKTERLLLFAFMRLASGEWHSKWILPEVISACKSEDWGFFIGLGKALSLGPVQRPSEPVEDFILKYWTKPMKFKDESKGIPPLAYFTAESVAEICRFFLKKDEKLLSTAKVTALISRKFKLAGIGRKKNIHARIVGNRLKCQTRPF